MNVLVATVAGSFTVDLDTDDVEPWDGDVSPLPAPALNLPRVVAAASVGSTVVAVVDAKPPLLVSHDTGSTWRESGRGLPPGRAIAISDDDPDLFVYAARNRLYLSRNGGVFWTALAVELPEIERLAL
ncbi:MAG: hypothetical protein QOH95_1029 [Gaiellaceae bacterium]|jgi:hypothetical protein|nr:hypothetical protein [Gaiellaceae bacterium]